MRQGNEGDAIYPTLAGHIGSLIGILFISSIACSFPSASNRFSFLRLPSAIFFIGKHFGTGVILSTAFVHLLTDAFSNLNNERVPARWRGGAGAIVMVSLLAIFVVEYVSTAYVERTANQPHPVHSEPIDQRERAEDEPLLNGHATTYYTGADGAHSHLNGSQGHHSHSHEAADFLEGHHRHEERGPAGKHHHERGGRLKPPAKSSADDAGDRRQIVGILVLQIGIMLHSLVIGITLAITSGSEFTSLLVAVIFHQLFEGLSLGVRISSLPNARSGLRILLCFFFSITMPIGIIIGLTAFNGGNQHHGASHISQGIMASISAGMLIYASTVEMLAGDFVMDKEIKLGSVYKQGIAVGSVILGATAMGILGCVKGSSFVDNF